MIIQENIIIDGRHFIRTYSDKNVLIHGGFPESDYAEACDPAELGRTYTETNIPIDADESSSDSEAADKAEAYDILTGVEA